MAITYLNKAALQRLVTKLKSKIPTRLSQLDDDIGVNDIKTNLENIIEPETIDLAKEVGINLTEEV